MSLALFNSIEWDITETARNLSTTGLKGAKYDFRHQKTKKLMDTKVTELKRGDKITILTYQDENPNVDPVPVITYKLRTQLEDEVMVSDVIASIDLGFKKKIKRPKGDRYLYLENGMDKNEYIYSRISRFKSSSTRLRLITLYESNKLTPRDLCTNPDEEHERFFSGLWKYEGEPIKLWFE
jgi:hypothetical protein